MACVPRAFFITALALGWMLGGARAHATATYQWQGTDPTGCCGAIIVISDDAYAAGYFSSHIEHDGPPQALAGNPVVHFELTAYGDRLVFDRDRVRGYFDFDMSILGSSLSGEIHVNDLSTDSALSGTKDQWSVKNHHADHPGPCFLPVNTCSGDTGRWVLVSAPSPAP
jgi:hypothetical protein